MPSATWLDLLTAAIGGGLLVKALDVAYQEYKRRSESTRAATDLVNRHLDPVLKAADELIGKLRSLAEEDFRNLKPPTSKAASRDHAAIDLGSVLYLFAFFWANIKRLTSLLSKSFYVGHIANK